MHSKIISLMPFLQRALRRSASQTLAGVLAGMMIIFAHHAFGQMVEERDRDEPPTKQPAGVPKETMPDLSTAEQMIVEQTNEFRKHQELDAVQPNPKLNETAQYFADFMAQTGKYGHTADGNRPSERAANHDYDYCIVAENIAYQFNSGGFSTEELAGRFVSGWKQSPEHRKNMLDPDVTETGLAVARSQDSPTFFAVQMFGRPQSEAISFQVTNQSGAEVEYTLSRNGSEKTFPLPPRLRRTHERCRPTEIEFSKPDTTLQVEDGAEYVVRQSPDGTLEVSQQ
ncbi:MAG: CAP domain-containing protein [Pirellulaceae bacterium]